MLLLDMPVGGSFLEGFQSWLSRLTPAEFMLTFGLFLVFDLSRALAKPLIIGILSVAVRKGEEKRVEGSRVSLIIPAHNEERSIVETIDAALDADYPDKEVIVVDDGSTDRTMELALPYAERGMIELVHREVASGNKATAINHGAAFANGDLIAVIDADTLIERGALAEMVKTFRDARVVAASGNVRILRGERGRGRLMVALQAYEYLVSFEVGRRFHSLLNTLTIIPGALGCFRAKEARSVGLFDKDTITEDFDITIKVRKGEGRRVAFAPDALSWTYCPDDWRSWIRQRKRWTHGQASTLRKHWNVLLTRRFQPSLIVAVLDMLIMDIALLLLRASWLGAIATIFRDYLLYLAAALLFLYLLCESISALTAILLSRRRRRDLLYLPLIPVMVLFYRPLYGFVRMKAYVDWLRGRRVGW